MRDLILIAGGLFLIVKATQEVHGEIEGEDEDEQGVGKSGGRREFRAIIAQIVVIDAIFSINSIITAVGMADMVEVMIAAVVLAIGVMYVASEPVAHFIERHPTTKMLALTFLMLVGVALVADGFHFHIPRSYIYSAMAFAAATEIFNIMAIRRRRLKRGKTRRNGSKPAYLRHSVKLRPVQQPWFAMTPMSTADGPTSCTIERCQGRSNPRFGWTAA